MDTEPPTAPLASHKLQHLKRVSRVKHVVLEKYLPPWAQILASAHTQLAYVDCFAGPGLYECEGKTVKGSPIIAAEEGIKFAKDSEHSVLEIYLVDENLRQVETLKDALQELEPYPKNLTVSVVCADSHTFIPNLLEQ